MKINPEDNFFHNRNNEQPIKLLQIKNENFIHENNNNSLKIYESLIYYFDFKRNFFKLNNRTKQNLFLIDKNWINNLKNKCHFDSLIKELGKNKELNSLIKEFNIKYPINENILYDKPRGPEKIKISFNNSYRYYYKDYKLIDEKVLKLFLEAFNMYNVNKEFK